MHSTLQWEILDWCKFSYISPNASPYKNKSSKNFCIQNFDYVQFCMSNLPHGNVDKVMVLHRYFQPPGALSDPMDPCPHMLALQQLNMQ